MLERDNISNLSAALFEFNGKFQHCHIVVFKTLCKTQISAATCASQHFSLWQPIAAITIFHTLTLLIDRLAAGLE